MNDYFSMHRLSRKANAWMLAKLVCCLAIFSGLYALILTVPLSLPLYFLFTLLFGVASALLIFNIGHDALHQALFQSKPLNRLFGYTFELAGMSSAAWHLKHNVIHHLYPNVTGVDFDIDAWPLMRLSPTDKLLGVHRYQHLYAPVAYMLFTLLLLFFNDFRILYNRRKQGDGKQHPVAGWIGLIVGKLLYLFFMLALPIIVLPLSWWQVVLGFIAMHAVLSLGISLVLVPSHLFEHTVYVSNDENERTSQHWAEHQLESTLDYAGNSKVANLFFGGLNTNAAHHLFPRVCHIHLVEVTNIVRQTAKEFGVKYHETSLNGAIGSHFRVLKQLGSNNSLHKIKS